MSVEAFFAWQERQAERYELVGGVAFPARPRLVQDETPGNAAS